MKTNQYYIPITGTFIWIGFVGAISFMEAWLKFSAPGITLSLGLGIGRLVFAALNKVEWAIAIAIILNILYYSVNLRAPKHLFLFIALGILLLQSVWLLPALDARAEQHIQGAIISPSNLHFYYIAAETAKTLCLSLFGIALLHEVIKNKTIYPQINKK